MRRIPPIVLALLIVVACGGGNETPRAGGATSSSPSPSITVPPGAIVVTNSKFGPRNITVSRGTDVMWINTMGNYAHFILSVDRLFNSHPNCTGAPTTDQHSGCMQIGETFTYTFTEPGEFKYFCPIHAICDGNKVCSGMYGVVTVT